MLRIEPLGKSHAYRKFDCGHTRLNNFLQKSARQQSDRGITRMYILMDENDPDTHLGYLSLTLCELSAELLPSHYANKFPSVMPVAKLGRLAISKSSQNRGLGELLIIFAMERALNVAQTMGIGGLFAEAHDKYAAEYYRQYGFLPLPSQALKLFLPIQTIRSVLQ